MAAVMGVVSQLVGEVFAVAADGSRRPLAAGDKVFAGEQLVTGANGAVALALSAGGELTLGRDSQMLLDPQALASAQPAESPAAATAAADAPAAAPSTQDLSDVEALQAAIAAGVDPTQVGEATAAGPGAGGAGGAAGGGHSFVLLDAVGASVDPEIGFPTEGLNGAPAFPDPEAALLQAPNTAPDALDDNSTGAADDALTTAEDTPLLIQPATLLGNDIDLDGDVLTIQSVQAAVNGTVSLGLDGSILFTPDPDFNGTGSFTYTVNDGNGGTDTATVTIGVTPVNDAPDAQDDNSTGAADDLLTTPEDTPLTISPLTLLVNDSDPEGDPLTIQSVQAAVNGTVTLGPDGNILFTPTPDFSGTASFTYTVNDGNGATDTATVTIVVLPVAEPPEPPPVPNTTSATDDALSTAEDTPLTISPATLLANDTDPEGNPQTIQSVQNAVNGSVSFAGGNIVFTPTADFSGVASFTYTLNDGQGATATATVFITVTPVNTPPEVNVDPGNEGGNDLVFEGSLANGSDAASNGEFATGSFTLSDADGLDDLQSVTINGVTVALGSLAGTVFAGANGNLTVTAYNPATGVASYSYELTSPTTDGPGVESETFSLSVSDGTASSVPASIVVEIVDDQPNAVDDGNAVAEGAVTAVTGNVLSNDLHANGQSGADTPTGFVAWSGTAASYGSFSDTGSGTYSYLLNNGSAAVQALDDGETLTETFTYSMRDADGDLASATLTITITGSNDGPEVSVDPGNEGGNDQVFEAGLAAGSDAASSSEFASGSFSLSDADGLDDLQSVTINGVTVALGSLVGSVFAGSHGNFTVTAYNPATGVASYSYELTSPTTDGPGVESDTFSLSVSDGTVSSVPASIVVEIVDDLPNAVDDGNAVAEGSLVAITGTVLSNDLHPNGQPGADTPTSFVAWSSTAASYGSFSDTGSGTYSYLLNNGSAAVQALDDGETLTETFTYSMRDADGDLASATLTLTITGSNDGPEVSVDPGNEGGNDQVFEAGLAAGSDAASSSEFASGSFSLSDADGLDDLQSVTINGVTVAIGSLVGSVFAGSHGNLTVTAYDSTTGVASYSYELTSPTTDGPGVESDTFSLSVSDGTASSVPASIVIEIIDDLPNAVDDGNSLVEDSPLAITGNVLSNDLHPNGQPGADTPTSFVAWSGTAASYGSFSDTGSGTYSYLLDNGNAAVQALDDGESLTETFSYSMRDADGDLDTATLTITITGSNDGPELELNRDPQNEGGNAWVFEAGLATGSNAAGSGEFTNGSFTLSDADGLDDLQSVTINGVTVALGSLAGTVFAGANGNLTVTAYNPATGVASYSYELTSPTTDGLGVESDTFSLSVSDGTASSAPANLVIEIIDDQPNAVDDGNGVVEGSLVAITGNVLGNDLHPNGQPGADTPTSFVAWSGTAASYGSFSDTGSGTYSYLLDNGNAAVQALDSGETLTETFTYSMRDADGDLASATLTITITGSNDVPQITVDPGNQGANDQVFEAALAAGSDAASNGEFATGSFSLSDADGLDDLQSVTINGVTVALGSLAGSVFAGANGNLTVTAYNPATGVASYSYELTSPTTDGPGVESDTFSLSVSDGTASSAPANLVIEIIDDQPNALDDGNSVVEGSLVAITGNVLSNDLHANGQPGADTPTSFVAWNGTAASYGSFSDTGSGTYSYLLNNASAAVQALDDGESLTETFTYSMRDADGDLASATLTITITGSNDVPQITVDPGNQGANDQVFEAGLATGSNAAGTGEFASGSFSLSDADGLDDLQSVTINGVTVALGSLVGSVFAGANGNLSVTAYNPATGVASYSYELISPTTDGPGVESDTFSLSVSDGTASSVPASIVIEIVDDLPNAVDDGNSVAEGSLLAITGNVLSNDLHPNGQPGADTPTSFVAWSSTAASYGSFSDTGSGTYSYLLNNGSTAVQALDDGETLTETFTYSMRDADGDLDTATLTLTITGSNDVPQITVDPGNQGANDQVFEAGLATGSNAAGTGEFASGSFSLSDADGLDDLQSVTINGVTVALGSLVGSVFAGSHGNLTVTAYNPATGVASYSYQLTSPTTDGPGVESDTFSLSVSDGTASSVPASIVIEIVDDLPNAVNDVNSQVEDSPLAITGNVLSNDLHPNGQPGADTPTSFVAWSSTVASYGSFSDTGSGTYSYLLNNGSAAVQALDMGETLTETFTYSMRDADGDLDTATLIITITGSNDVPQITVDPGNQGANDQVFESALATGSNAVGNGEFASGSFTLTDVDGLDDLQSVSINGTIVVLGSLVGSVFAGGHGNLTITAYNPATGVASYSYQLTSPTIDAPGTETDVFSLSVSDGSAWSTTAFIVLEIVDDQPNAVNDGNSVVEGSLVAITGNVLSNDLHPNGQPGADTPTSFMGWGSVIGTYGTFTDTGNGTYSYSLNNANVAVQALEVGQTLTETFTYSMRDADGDLDTAVLTITIIGSNDVPQVTVDPGNQGANDQVFEAGLASGSNAPSNSEFATGTFTLSDADGLADLQSVTLNGVTVGIGSLAGSVFAGGHGTLTVTGYNPATGVATYTYQLTNPTTDGPGIETDTFSLSVFDGTASSVPASIVIEIIDDLPVAYSDSNSLAEGGVVGGNVLGNDVMGADGPLAGGAVVGVRTGGDTSTPAAGAVGTSLSGTYGTLQLNADGSYTYTGTPNLVPPSGATEVFTYTISDADGDLSTTTLTLTLTDSGMLAANDLDALVHENALDLVQGGADLAPGTVTGSLPGSALETDSSNTLVGAVSGGVGAITYALVGSATGAFGVIHINPDGSYVYTLTGPAETMPNANNGTDQVITETFTYSATDANGNSAMGSILVTIVDDVPTLGDFTPASLPNEVGTVNGVFVLEAGADGLAGFQISGPPLSGVTYSSVNNFDGLGGFVSTTLTATGPGSVTLFTLTVNADETYSFNLVTPEATTTETVSLLNLTAGGPQPWVETADGRIEFTGNSTGVNSSTQGFGVANQFLGVGESFTMEFHNPGAVGNDAPGSSPQLVDSVLLTNNSVNGSLTIQWTATNTTTGVVQTGTVAVSGSTTNIDPSISFNQLEISGVSGSGQGVRFSSATVSTSILPEDQNLTFNIVAQDGDGDMDGATLVVDIVVTADPNLAPDALNDSATTLQGVPVTIDVLANDSDANGNPLNIVSVSNSAPVYGTTAIVNGQIVYTPTTNPGPGGLTDQFTYTISDGQGGGDTATVTVTITDALPTAVADTTTPGATRTESVNLILVLDSSGSISNSQMTLIKGAVTNLISTYGAALVKVMLVDFDDSATVFTSSGSAWLTGAAATSIINSSSITNGGGTDYDSAIAAVQSSFAGAPLADKTYMYFLSDGEPTGNDGSNDNSISAAERTAWVNFASNSGGAVPRIHEVYSVGIGSGSLTTQLNQVAWSSTGGSNVFIISSVSQLSGTLTQISDSSTGNVTSNDLPGADGWATARLVSVTYGATTYNFNAGDAINNEVTIALGATQGTLIIRENGTYTYTPPSAGASGADVSVTYVIRDADGSTSSATLTVDIAPLAPAPLAATSSFAFTEEPDGLLMDGDDDEGAGMQALGVSGPAPESELADAGSLTDAPTPDEQSQLLVDGSQPDDPDPSLEGPAGDTLPLAAELASLLEPQDDSADPTLDSDLLMAADDQGAAAGYTQVHVESIADVYLDLASLLVGETDDVNVLSQYLSFSVSATSTSIGISPLGDGAVSQGVELQGIDLASHYGVGTEAGGLVADANEATIIQGLLGDGALHVDTV